MIVNFNSLSMFVFVLISFHVHKLSVLIGLYWYLGAFQFKNALSRNVLFQKVKLTMRIIDFRSTSATLITTTNRLKSSTCVKHNYLWNMVSRDSLRTCILENSAILPDLILRHANILYILILVTWLLEKALKQLGEIVCWFRVLENWKVHFLCRYVTNTLLIHYHFEKFIIF